MQNVLTTEKFIALHFGVGVLYKIACWLFSDRTPTKYLKVNHHSYVGSSVSRAILFTSYITYYNFYHIDNIFLCPNTNNNNDSKTLLSNKLQSETEENKQNATQIDTYQCEATRKVARK